MLSRVAAQLLQRCMASQMAGSAFGTPALPQEAPEGIGKTGTPFRNTS